MSYFNDPAEPPACTAGPAFSHRVQALLKQLQALAGTELRRELERLLDTLEQDMFRQAEKTRNGSTQSVYLHALGTLRTNRHTLVERFTTEFAAALSSLRPCVLGDDPSPDVDLGALRLVDHSEVTETNVLTAIARRHESRAGLPLLLLGQRFGVLAGRPAFDAASLPIGPAALAAMLSRASTGVTGDVETRLQLYHLFDRQMLAGYVTLVEAMNALLDGADVLPGLSFVPIQSRNGKGERNPGAPTPGSAGDEGGESNNAANADIDASANGFSGYGSTPGQRSGAYAPYAGNTTSTFGGRVDTAEERQALQQLQQLLTYRRPVSGMGEPHLETSGQPHVALDAAEVDAALSSLQALRDDTAGPRNPGQVREALLERSDQQLGRATSLSYQDDETFELLGLLYNEIGREMRHGSRAAELLERLQVPLLRVALQDRGFFVRRQHPARQLLDAIAEADTQWLDGIDGDADPGLDHQLREAVDHVVEHFQGDPGVFASAHQALNRQLESLARKAEIAQRRQVEAARGRDKLERAKQQAANAIQAAIGDTPVPKFLATLLEQAWTDVLSLTLLRHGEESAEWCEHLDATARIIAANRGEQAPQSLQPRVTEALGLVGYQGEEATAIAGRLVGTNDDSDDPATRTELAVKLKARARLGGSEIPPLPPQAAPRNAREEECFAHLRSLPFGSSIEFNINQQGDRVRRRLAWYSPVTGRVLLLNQKGQRSDDQHGRETLDQIARLLAVDEARVISTDAQGSLVDRAWQATLGKLRSLGRSDRPAEMAQ